MRWFWSETSKQSRSFIINEDCQTLARNVISAAGFGMHLPFKTFNSLPEDQRQVLDQEIADYENKN
jgi:hypothetical protein